MGAGRYGPTTTTTPLVIPSFLPVVPESARACSNLIMTNDYSPRGSLREIHGRQLAVIRERKAVIEQHAAPVADFHGVSVIGPRSRSHVTAISASRRRRKCIRKVSERGYYNFPSLPPLPLAHNITYLRGPATFAGIEPFSLILFCSSRVAASSQFPFFLQLANQLLFAS